MLVWGVLGEFWIVQCVGESYVLSFCFGFVLILFFRAYEI